MRETDALGDDPFGAFDASVRLFADAFDQPDVLNRKLDYPLGPVSGAQAMAERGAGDDLRRARGKPDRRPDNTSVFAAPAGTVNRDASLQDRLLHVMGRTPGHG